MNDEKQYSRATYPAPDMLISTSDHDLLIALHEQVKQVRVDIADIKEGTTAKILDHEIRIRRLEQWGAIAIGALTAAQFYFNYLRH